MIRFVTGTFAVQVRELPPPTSLTVDAPWLLDTIGMPDGLDLTNLRLFSFAATPETTYYVMVDDKGGDWRDTNGGYVSGTHGLLRRGGAHRRRIRLPAGLSVLLLLRGRRGARKRWR